LHVTPIKKFFRIDVLARLASCHNNRLQPAMFHWTLGRMEKASVNLGGLSELTHADLALRAV
jgi:hypothetical protein